MPLRHCSIRPLRLDLARSPYCTNDSGAELLAKVTRPPEIKTNARTRFQTRKKVVADDFEAGDLVRAELHERLVRALAVVGYQVARLGFRVEPDLDRAAV